MNHIVKVFLGLWCVFLGNTYLWASTYGSEAEADAGLAWGKTYAPGRAVGLLTVNYGPDTGIASNAVLITPTQCLCTRHVWKEGMTWATVIFHGNPNIVQQASKEGKSVLADSTKLTDIKANVTGKIFHPTQDFVIATLDRPMDISPLPLAIDRPPSPVTGYLVSIAHPSIRKGGIVVPYKDTGRHVSAITVCEKRLRHLMDGTFGPCLTKDFAVVNETVRPSNAPPPCVGGIEGDSGAPFIDPTNGSIWGLTHGGYIYEKDGTTHSLIVIVPFYLEDVKSWLLEHASGIETVRAPSWKDTLKYWCIRLARLGAN